LLELQLVQLFYLNYLNIFKKENKEKINLIQNKALELSLFLSLPAAMALLIASEEIISSLFGYGSFDELSVKKLSKKLYFILLLVCQHFH